jgi:probable rRNA maturation factor
MTFEVDITTDSQFGSVGLERLQQSVVQALQIESVAEAVLSVTLVDNAAIHEINRQYLQHDFATDVISFQLDWTHPELDAPGTASRDRSAGAHIQGEIIASIEYAAGEADRLDWELQSELTLYVIHGMLHICGYDDLDPTEKQIMQARESAILNQLGLSEIPRCAACPQPPDGAKEAVE